MTRASLAAVVLLGCAPGSPSGPALLQVPATAHEVQGATVTWSGLALPGADAATFRDLGDGWAVDKNHAWYKQIEVYGADPATFRAVETDIAIDQNALYRGIDKTGQRFAGGRYGPSLADTVQRTAGFVDGTHARELHRRVWSDGHAVIHVDRVVSHVDAATLKYEPDGGFFRDVGSAYGPDLTTLHVRVRGEVVPMDPHLTHEGSRYWSNPQGVFWCDQGRCTVLDGADRATFEVGDDGLAHDSRHRFRRGQPE